MDDRYFILRRPEQPWGDYGDILWCGMTGHLQRRDGLLQLEHTGPFVPPAFLSGISDLLVTDAVRKSMELAALRGLEFRPVLKAHIVGLAWHEWDKSSDEPPVRPDSGEPEDYILQGEHSPALAAEIGNIWEVVVPREVHALKPCAFLGFGRRHMKLCLRGWGEADIFRATNVDYVFVTGAAREVLSQACSQCFHCEPIEAE